MFEDCYFDFDAHKNTILQKERGVSFEQIIILIENGNVIAVKPHHNQKKYQNQHIAEILAGDYICLVPFVVDGNKVFLKTVYLSRKATKSYKRGKIDA